MAVTTCEVASLASNRLLGVGSASHCGGGYDRLERCSGLSSLGRRRLRQPQCWRARQVMALLYPLFAFSAWAQPASVVAGTKCEGASVASVRLIGVGSAS
jgi:hypothetical protein